MFANGPKDMNYSELTSTLAQIDSIGKTHMIVPNSKETLGFDGHCFPKDTSAIVKTADNNKVDLTLLKTALEYNNIIQSL